MNPSSQPPAGNSSQPLLDNTHMAATRTLLAVVRTGAAISGGGALVTDLLIKGWPRWVVVTLASGFVVLGYALMWSALKKGRRLRERIERERPEEVFLFPLREVMIGTVALQLLIAAVLLLYILG